MLLLRFWDWTKRPRCLIMGPLPIKKKIHKKVELNFNFPRKIPIKKILQIYKRNPSNFFPFFSKGVYFNWEIPVNFFWKKINPEIWPQKYPLRRWSWRPFLKKSSYQCDFENSWKFSQLDEKIKPTRFFSAFITIVIYTHIYLKYIPYYY